ncbi:MAG: hypothetical protein RL392_27 [Pseudomonadota bacterium]|jgi:hypothetical protein
MSLPGFFLFRWQTEQPAAGAEDIAVVFKVPGAVDLSVLPDLIESVCAGPIVPSVIVMLQLGEDGLIEALKAEPVKNALARFTGRMPLLVFAITPAPYSLTLIMELGASVTLQRELTKIFMKPSDWVRAGLATVFDPKVVVVTAPSGYAFLKPSNERSTYFIRAELALSKSTAVTFVAFAIFQRLVRDYGKVPQELRLLLVDTMNVAAIAFALREMLLLAGVKLAPQVESFHSYGGMDQVASPLPDTSLCIVSASSSMNLHRKWTREKALSARDIVTLVTFEDAEGAQHALYGLPTETRPAPSSTSSTYDIRITGEYFFPAMEQPRKVLLTTTHHGCPIHTNDFYRLRDRQLFGAFRSAGASETRRGLFIDADALLNVDEFQDWINTKVPQLLRAGTKKVIFQNDAASAKLAQHVAHIAIAMGCTEVQVCNAIGLDEATIDPTAPLVCVAAVVGRGNALLSLSRDLRNCHFGARLFLIGMQVTESLVKLDAFDRNLKHSSHKSPIEVQRKNAFLTSDAVTESFQQELTLYKGKETLSERKENLQSGLEATQVFLPSGPNLDTALVLNVDFAFWDGKYEPSAYQAQVLATISNILQNARTSKLRFSEQQLRSPMLMHVALDPENFARFNEGIIQAALLRSALPSELDYRGDVQASAYMVTLLKRIASKFDHRQMATLEFLSAIATRRLLLNPDDTMMVKDAFRSALGQNSNPMVAAVLMFLDAFPLPSAVREAF